MSDDPTQNQPDPEPTDPPTPDPVETPEPEPTPEPAAASTEPEPTPGPDTSQAPDWRDRRIVTLTARLREAERRIAQTTTQTGEVPETPPTVPQDQSELDRLVEARAEQRRFIERCNEVATQGHEQYGADFDNATRGLYGLIDANSPQEQAQYNLFLAAALETGKPVDVLRQLGGNLNEAARILALPAVRMGIEMERLAVKPADPAPSNAPRPIRPVNQTAGSHDRISPDDPDRGDRLSTAEWMRRREAQLAERQGSRR